MCGLEADRAAPSSPASSAVARRRFADSHDLLARPTSTCVSHRHPDRAARADGRSRALDAGVHVLSEKPIAETPPRPAEMVAAAERNDRVLDVSYNHRRRGVVKALCEPTRRRARSATIYYAKAGWMRRQGIPGLGSWFTRAGRAGGGPFMDIGVHMIDIVLHLLGEPAVTTVTAATYAEFGPRGRGSRTGHATRPAWPTATFDVEDLATAFCRLVRRDHADPRGQLGPVGARTTCASSTVYGTDAGAGITWVPTSPQRSMQVWSEENGGQRTRQPELPPDGEHRETVVDFLDLVRSGRPAHGRDLLTRSVIIDACYASAEQGRELELSGNGHL